jgi:protein gp37
MFDRISDGLWWDIGLNLVEGCTKVSPGCDNCWSLTGSHRKSHQANPKMQARYAGVLKYGQTAPDRTDTRAHFQGPPTWTGQVNPQWDDLDKIGRSRTPKVYTFWNDLFHPGVPEEFINEVMLRIIGRLEHFYIICTKRPDRAQSYFACWSQDYRHDCGNRLMLMTSVENQATADQRLPLLLQIPGILHGVNYEPALAPVDFGRWLPPFTYCIDYIDGGCTRPENPFAETGNPSSRPGLLSCRPEYCIKGLRTFHWLCAGGETGPGARPSHPDWFRQARDQAVAAGVPFFFKQWGEYLHKNQGAVNPAGPPPRGNINNGPGSAKGYLWPDGWSIRVGKKQAGRLLDGREWKEVPVFLPMLEHK